MPAIATYPRRRRFFAPISLSVLVKKIKKSFRETLRPLKSLKTAKSGNFCDQRYQILSKTHDFADEAISFRLASFSLRRRLGIPSWRERAQPGRDRKNLENPSTRENSYFRRVNL
jgi:hypothetical protein